MKVAIKSPSYLVRNPYSYCFRLIVPKDLQPFVGKKELRYSLKTGYIGPAKQKTRFLAGHFQLLFRYLRKGNTTLKELSKTQIQEIVNNYFKKALERLDERWLSLEEVDYFPPRDDTSNYPDLLDCQRLPPCYYIKLNHKNT